MLPDLKLKPESRPKVEAEDSQSEGEVDGSETSNVIIFNFVEIKDRMLNIFLTHYLLLIFTHFDDQMTILVTFSNTCPQWSKPALRNSLSSGAQIANTALKSFKTSTLS